MDSCSDLSQKEACEDNVLATGSPFELAVLGFGAHLGICEGQGAAAEDGAAAVEGRLPLPAVQRAADDAAGQLIPVQHCELGIPAETGCL